MRGCGDDDKVYVCRERKGDIVYGVLFTRSIGDYDAHQNLGVESKPEVSERECSVCVVCAMCSVVCV